MQATPPHIHGLATDRLREIDRLCTRFESQWKSGSGASIEDFCRTASPDDSDILFRELLLLELEYRVRRGDSPSMQEYAARFPERLQAVGDAWEAHRRASGERQLPEIQGYHVLRRIGRGGMASVYLARDGRLGRRVALKLLSSAEPSEQTIARLTAEAQALARLAHPNIVQIYEIAQHAGQPYLALEFIEGGSLAENIAGTPRAPRAAAEMVETLARAVHAAHGHGVVHRDLKPANILLDTDGQPKITDFGLAKLIDADTAQTQSGMVLGTASYMAPEAIDSPRSVGPSVDIYALGAILYELITARPPFKAATVIETTLLVRRTDPVPPRHLQPHTPIDLETVCLRCLEKDPSARYATALELAEDLRRFIDGQPVRARPVGPVGRLARWSRRNPLSAGLIAAVGVALVGGTLVSSYFAVEANRRARENLRLADEADARRKQAETVERYLVNAFRSADPQRDGRTVTIVEVLDRSVASLPVEFADQPLIHAELAHALGRTYLGLGLWSSAVPLLERGGGLLELHRGADDPRTIVIHSTLAQAYAAAGDADRATATARTALDRARAALGEDHPQTLDSTHALAEAYELLGRAQAAVELRERVLEWSRRRLGEDHPSTLGAANALGNAYRLAGRVEQAKALLESSAQSTQTHLGPDHPQTIVALMNLAEVYFASERLFDQRDEVIDLLERVLELSRSRLGDDHPRTLKTRVGLAQQYRVTRQLDKAIPLLEDLLEHHRAVMGADHPDTLNALSHLATAYDHAGRFPDALPLHQQTHALRSDKLGPTHPLTLQSLGALASASARAGDLDRAVDLLRECVRLHEEALPGQPMTFYARAVLGKMLSDAQEYEEAERNLLDGYAGLRSTQDRMVPMEKWDRMLFAPHFLIELYEKWEKPEEAQRWREEKARVMEALKPASRPPDR